MLGDNVARHVVFTVLSYAACQYHAFSKSNIFRLCFFWVCEYPQLTVSF